jgi:hypothetical protein
MQIVPPIGNGQSEISGIVQPRFKSMHFHLLQHCFFLRSTRDQRGNCDPVIVTARFHCILQLAVFVFCPFTRTSSAQGDAWIQGIMSSAPTLFFRSTWNEHGNCGPILVTVHLYRILQLAVFVFYPCTHKSIRPVDAGILDILPRPGTTAAIAAVSTLHFVRVKRALYFLSRST